MKIKNNGLSLLATAILILTGCATTDQNAELIKGRIIAYAAPTRLERIPTAAPSTVVATGGTTATVGPAINVTLTTVNAQRVLYRVKLDNEDEVSMLARHTPPNGLRVGECIDVLLSNKPGYPRFAGRNTNCTYATDGTKAIDANDLAKTFHTDAQLAGVYIYRNELFYWGAMDVMIDGAFIAKPQSFYYVWKQLPPGRHSISAQGTEKHEIEINVEAGRNYFVWLEAKGSYGGPKPVLHVMDETIGKKEISAPELLLLPAK